MKGEKVKPIFEEPPNPTNVEASLQRIKANDPSLIEVNLNNIKVDAVVSFMSSRKVYSSISSPCLLSSNFVSLYYSEKAGQRGGNCCSGSKVVNAWYWIRCQVKAQGVTPSGCLSLADCKSKVSHGYYIIITSQIQLSLTFKQMRSWHTGTEQPAAK